MPPDNLSLHPMGEQIDSFTNTFFRFDCDSGLQCRGDGELGPDHLPRELSSLLRVPDLRDREAMDRRCGRSRACASVVRKSRHHEVVERHLAQRR